MTFQRWIASFSVVGAVVAAGAGLSAWKAEALQRDAALSAGGSEPMEVVAVATARPHASRERVTAVGTVLATRSVGLRNELAGTVRSVSLEPGRIVEPGTVLVRLDVAVEEAELAALDARAALAESLLARSEQAMGGRAVSEAEVDRARAERDVVRAERARVAAVIDKKTLRAPFRARVGLADVHPGQYLEAGTELTTLQGVSERVWVDFSVTQQVAARLAEGGEVAVWRDGASTSLAGKILAADSRVDVETRTARVRAIVDAEGLAPGASVRVEIPVGETVASVAVPASALRRGPEGDHVYVIEADENGTPRAFRRAVVSGLGTGTEAIVLGGLAPGETVAASGSFKLREAVAVVVAEGPEPRV